ncbi:MAG: hypothetical protein GY702_13810, partial [Desulfobulbaceae bacterium]|nr:hypothetical protein [Desulfobulbaceae bacterium]
MFTKLISLFFGVVSCLTVSSVLIQERFAETAYAAGNPPVNNTLEVIEQRGKLLVGVDIPYGIMEYYDDSGN